MNGKDIILDTSPTNKYQSEIAINSLYKTADLEPPEIVWFENPIDAYLWLGEKSDIMIKRNWKEVVKSLGFGIWWALSDLAVVVSKPSAIKLDDNLRLHSEDEPALEYKQASTITDEHFKIYANHGNLLLIK